MCPVGYDYDRDNGPGSSRGRAILIFIVALIVIGCGIYFFIMPHSTPVLSPNAPETPSSADPGTASPAKDAAINAAAKSVEGNEPSPAPDTPGNNSPATSDADSPQSPEQQTGTENAGNAGDDASGNPTGLSGKEDKNVAPTPAADPQKVKPWIGDPPSEQPSAETPAPPPAQFVDPAASAVTVAVRAGDSLSRLALRHHTTVEALRHYNKLKKDVIRIGQKLRVIPGPWRITVDKGQRVLMLERLHDGTWSEFAKFSVGLGRLNSTPDAQFVISTRLRHPDWYMPDGRIFRYGDPENQLGDYFLKLAMTGTPDKPLLGYGIHGTPDENSVGKNWSNGCIRMRNRDVEILYYLGPAGTPVKIVPGADEPRKTEI